MDDNQPTRWTVPQAAVWIRTRSLDAVNGLDERQARSLALAEMEWSGAKQASLCLKRALGRGRVDVLGHAAKMDIAVITGVTGELSPWILDTDAKPVPRAFWQAGAAFSDDLGEPDVYAVAPGKDSRWVRLMLDADACRERWPSPAQILDGESLPIGAFLSEFLPESEEEPEERLAWLLDRDDVTVTGLNAGGERVAIDRDVFRTGGFIVDEANSLRAGGLRWPSVMVSMSSEGERPAPGHHGIMQDALPVEAIPPPPSAPPAAVDQAAAPTPPPPPSAPVVSAKPSSPLPVLSPGRGRPATMQDQMRAHLAKVFPNGTKATIPEVRKVLEAVNLNGSTTTIARALGRRADADRASKVGPK